MKSKRLRKKIRSNPEYYYLRYLKNATYSSLLNFFYPAEAFKNLICHSNPFFNSISKQETVGTIVPIPIPLKKR